jgi:hypothetical protein
MLWHYHVSSAMQASSMLLHLYANESQALLNIGGDKHVTTPMLLTIIQTGDNRDTRMEVKASQSCLTWRQEGTAAAAPGQTTKIDCAGLALQTLAGPLPLLQLLLCHCLQLTVRV